MKHIDPSSQLFLPFIMSFFYKMREMCRNIYEWNQINQTILEIDFDRTSWNELIKQTCWTFGISICYQDSIFSNTFQCHWTSVFETISSTSKGCQIWKIYILSFRIITILLLIVNEHDLLQCPPRVQLPSVMDCNAGRSIDIFSFTFIQYFRLLLIRN